MRYPAIISWCDREPVDVQEEDNGTVRVVVHNDAECLAALDRMERDMRETTHFLDGEIVDKNGNTLYFGMSDWKDQGHLGYQPRHLKFNDKGHFNGRPTRWAVSESAVLPQRGWGQPRDDTWIAFYRWKASYPNDMSEDHCIPLTALRQAICEYLTTGGFSKSITWAEYVDVPFEVALESGYPVRLTKRFT